MELFDTCHPIEIEHFKKQVFQLSADVLEATKRSTAEHVALQEEFGKIVLSAERLKLVMDDQLLVGEHLLKGTKTLEEKVLALKQVLQSISDTSQQATTLYQSTTQAFASDDMFLDNFNAMTAAAAANRQNALTKPLFNVEMVYSTVCLCLFACLLSKKLGNSHIAAVILTIVSVLKLTVSHCDIVYTGIELVSCQFVLFVWAIASRPRKEKRLTCTTAVSTNI